MTAMLMTDNLLRFHVDGSMLNLGFMMAFPLNAFLQGKLVQWMA